MAQLVECRADRCLQSSGEWNQVLAPNGNLLATILVEGSLRRVGWECAANSVAKLLVKRRASDTGRQ